MTTAEKIKQLRIEKGLSQETLATQAGLSLRTIQRIENGATSPYGDTLRKIAGALSVETTDLIIGTVKSGPKSKNGTLGLINLTALSFIIFPFLSVIVPLTIWILKREELRDQELEIKKMLNFEITWNIVFVIIYIGGIMGKIGHLPHLGNVETVLLSILSMYVLNFLLVAANSIRSMLSRSTFYQPAIKFIR
ncbi:helix-turn-helix domain-containing protein [Mucilaginibacter sp. RS28]|uniref:Helix-turn-helix domain-containing protein n=1 Tax=Mucilaginibacter straminoryzae TaxID=2932774 RepID=A0A9X1X3X6_9SPHI|nr:helix-turn-helix domain-containing protein [Mucilaginibacter straminoryzae]MCJ8209915.1 helix-turn-helix domain-containing protein [Mucilaginibacter straminoryzae]